MENTNSATHQVDYLSLDVEQCLHMYEKMLKIRLFDEQVNELYKTAKMPGLAHLYIGEEAIAVGVCEALESTDYTAPSTQGNECNCS